MSAVDPRKADQQQWLAEAALALAEAERLTGMLALGRPRHDLALAALQGEITGLRREIEQLGRMRDRESRRRLHPEWMEYSVWQAPVR